MLTTVVGELLADLMNRGSPHSSVPKVCQNSIVCKRQSKPPVQAALCGDEVGA